ncbi:MAG: VWA domain-containing protein [Balneolaceae bacterium]
MIWFEPSYLWLLLLIPASLLLLYVYSWRRKKIRQRYFDDRLLANLRKGYWFFGERLRLGLLMTAFLFFTVGLAGPQIGTEVRDMEQRGVDLMVILDLSRSMNAEDIRPSRLEKAKFEIERLISHSSGDRIGLIVFTGEAFVQSPMTLDHSALRMFLDIAETGQMPSSTTDIGASFGRAAESFETLEELASDAARVVLLVSDGEVHGPDFSSALDALVSQGVMIFTVGIGTEEGGRIPVYNRNTGQLQGHHRGSDGQEVVTRLEPQILQQIARRGGGNYYEISANTADISPFLTRLDDLQTGEFAVREFADYSNRYQWLLVSGLVLLVAALLIPGFRQAETESQT